VANPRAGRQSHFAALTGLRFVLALWVILHHLTGHGQMLERAALALPPLVYVLIRGGYLAVTTFFVLSGFVLSRSYSETAWSARNLARYGAGRIARVYPVYLLSLAVVAPFVAADATPEKTPLVAAHGLLLQGWLGHIPVNWNTPAWSLSCEAFFYVSFPLAATVVLRAGSWRTLAVALGACTMTRVLWACGVPDTIKPIVHLSDFLMGVAAARTYGLMAERGWARSGAWLYVPAVALGGAAIARPEWLPRGVDLNSALRPLNAALLIGLAIGGGAAARALGSRVVVYLGKASYAMYILHVPLLWWYLRWSRAASGSVYLGAVIGVSTLVYRFVEEPANRWLRARVQVALEA
jgi:peptidoglycan/LPS O-acetylase OafA/YrhL